MTSPEKEKSIDSTTKPILKKSIPPCEEIKKRRTQELVVAFCGPLGSGVSNVVKKFKTIAEGFNYKVNTIQIRDFIAKNAEKIAIKIDTEALKEYEKIEKLQKSGNLLRKNFGNDILAQLAITDISANRLSEIENIGENDIQNDKADETIKIPIKSRRVITVIDAVASHNNWQQFFRLS